MLKSKKNYYGAVLVVLFGLGAIVGGADYSMGTLARMGPGFFPVALGVLLVATGIVIALEGDGDGTAEQQASAKPEWRGQLCILGGSVAFIVLGKYGGLLPATFAIAFISGLGDRHNSLIEALALAVGMCVVAVVVFWWALHLQFPLFRWG